MSSPLLPDDEHHLSATIAAAASLAKQGRYPFTARLVDANGAVLGSADNDVALTGDPTAHAEMVLLRQTAPGRSRADFARYTLYAAAEPCAMCAAAIVWSGVGRVVYALSGAVVRERDPLPSGMSEPGVSGREVLERTINGPLVSGPHLEAEGTATLFPDS